MIIIDNGARLKTYQIENTDIEDIEVASTFTKFTHNNIEETSQSPTPRHVPDTTGPISINVERPLPESDSKMPIAQPTETFTVPSPALHDPAILTYAKSPTKMLAVTLDASTIRPALVETKSARAPEPVAVSKITKRPRANISTAAALLAKPVSLYAKTVPIRAAANVKELSIPSILPAPLSGSSAVAAVEVGALEKCQDVSFNAAESVTSDEVAVALARQSPARRRHGPTHRPSTPPPGEAEFPSWRQTPLLERSTKDVPRTRQTTAASAPGAGRTTSSARKKSTRNQKVLDGWGTEEAGEIQEMADFDFAGNLSKFDKQSVFEQLKNDDTTADEDRLVSFNRAGPAGTFGGTKLHFLENVIGKPRMDSANSDSDVDHELAESTHFRRPPRTASRAGSRMSRPLESVRKGTSIGSENVHPEHVERPNSAYATIHRHTQSPHISAGREHALNSPLGFTNRRPSLRYEKTRRVCQTAHPETLGAVAEAAFKVYGITDDITTEHAGRGIAEIALATLNPGSRRIYAGNHNAQPVIVVLTGDNLGGARALAAARHLAERGVRIVAATTGSEDSHVAPFTGFGAAVTPQLLRFGGRAMSWGKAAALLKTLDAPPELIIDGLLDIHTTFADLTAADESVALSMLGWANKSKASVLAVDLPSGVDAVTGQVEVRDGEPLEVRAKIVACCGAPCVGVLRAMEERVGDGQEWLVEVIDIGINGAWRDMPTTSRGGKWVAFGGEWVVRLRYDLSHG